VYVISFYVPEEELEKVKNEMFQAGAGKIGYYQQACWQTRGEGQYMPLEGASPAYGTKNKLYTLKEYKVEMVCDEKYIVGVIKAFKKSHPYEEPGYYIFKNEEIPPKNGKYE